MIDAIDTLKTSGIGMGGWVEDTAVVHNTTFFGSNF
tara:strand:- start:79 stop:186 length:108 start_codon:yes stop_codon:yes gene_type:complete